MDAKITAPELVTQSLLSPIRDSTSIRDHSLHISLAHGKAVTFSFISGEKKMSLEQGLNSHPPGWEARALLTELSILHQLAARTVYAIVSKNNK